MHLADMEVLVLSIGGRLLCPPRSGATTILPATSSSVTASAWS